MSHFETWGSPLVTYPGLSRAVGSHDASVLYVYLSGIFHAQMKPSERAAGWSTTAQKDAMAAVGMTKTRFLKALAVLERCFLLQTRLDTGGPMLIFRVEEFTGEKRQASETDLTLESVTNDPPKAPGVNPSSLVIRHFSSGWKRVHGVNYTWQGAELGAVKRLCTSNTPEKLMAAIDRFFADDFSVSKVLTFTNFASRLNTYMVDKVEREPRAARGATALPSKAPTDFANLWTKQEGTE